MRNPNLTAWVAGLVMALAACGGSAGQIKAAEQAHYQGDKDQLFQALKGAVSAKYPIESTEEANLVLKTTGRWYTPDGLAASERMDDIRDVPDRSIHIAFLVKLLPDAGAYVIDVKPQMYRLHAGSPQPEPLTEDDISVPGWAHGKKDALLMLIHDALQSYEVKTQMTPTNGPPGATPATGTGTEAGSAAGTGTEAGSAAGSGTEAGSAAGSATPTP